MPQNDIYQKEKEESNPGLVITSFYSSIRLGRDLIISPNSQGGVHTGTDSGILEEVYL